MNIIKTEIPDVLIFEPKVFEDSRGYFFESFSKRQFEEVIGQKIDFVQDNQSRSSYGVIRGLHYQKGEYSQAKLVRCIVGRVLDIAIDLRRNSPTFGRQISVELNEVNRHSVFIPRGFAHGFAVLSETAVFQYKCDNYYNPQSEGGIFPLDAALGIDWKIAKQSAIISDKDLKLPLFNQADF